MKRLICEMCGGTDLVKQDGVFVCQNCGMKYSVEEAKKMMVEVEGTVKVDNSEKLKNLYQTARRYRDQDNNESAAKYYDMILAEDPDSWEALFYSVYCNAWTCTIAGMSVAISKVTNCVSDVYELINKNETPEDTLRYGEEVNNKCKYMSDSFKAIAKNHYDNIDSSIRDNYYSEYEQRVSAAKDLWDTSIRFWSSLKYIIKLSEARISNGSVEEVYDEILLKAVEAFGNDDKSEAIALSNSLYMRIPSSPAACLAKAIAYATYPMDTDLTLLRKAAEYEITEEDKKRIEAIKDYAGILLCAAAAQDNYDAVTYLLDLGIDANAKYESYTALWYVRQGSSDAAILEADTKIAKVLLDHGASINVKEPLFGEDLFSSNTAEPIAKLILEKYPDATRGSSGSFSSSGSSSGGCYVATAVYGSYDCPQVWTLRRYRDYTLAESWYGRAFIRTYYAVSPTLVKWFGDTQWFKNMWKPKLDRMVENLRAEGVEDTPYEDKAW